MKLHAFIIPAIFFSGRLFSQQVSKDTAYLKSPQLKIVIANNAAYGPVHRAGYSGIAERRKIICANREYLCADQSLLNIQSTITIIKHKTTHYFIQKTIAFFALEMIAAKRLGLHRRETPPMLLWTAKDSEIIPEPLLYHFNWYKSDTNVVGKWFGNIFRSYLKHVYMAKQGNSFVMHNARGMFGGQVVFRCDPYFKEFPLSVIILLASRPKLL